MKLDFDPRKNITKLDYFIMQFDKVNRKIKDLLVVKSIVNNWYDVILFRVGLKKPGFIMWLRNGKKIEIKKPEDYFSFWESGDDQQALVNLNRPVKIIEKNKTIEFKFDNKPLKFNYDSQKQLHNTLSMIKEQFIDEQYKQLDVKNRVVIDIGANIGDSAIYFALKGAKHVYAFEPYPYSYMSAIKNIRLNKLDDKITLLNEGCGKSGFITMAEDTKNYGGSDLRNSKNGNGIKIRIESLDQIVESFNLNDALLKIDCEGCEYGTLLNAKKETLQKFNQMIIEYHYGYKNLVKKLEDVGFKVKITMPKYAYNIEAENKNMYIGLIDALRINNL
jgi:FkbM family methyltransferase